MLKWYIAASNRIAKSRKGATMVEYAILIALVSVVAIASLKLIGGTLSDKTKYAADQLTS